MLWRLSWKLPEGWDRLSARAFQLQLGVRASQALSCCSYSSA